MKGWGSHLRTVLENESRPLLSIQAKKMPSERPDFSSVVGRFAIMIVVGYLAAGTGALHTRVLNATARCT